MDEQLPEKLLLSGKTRMSKQKQTRLILNPFQFFETYCKYTAKKKNNCHEKLIILIQKYKESYLKSRNSKKQNYSPKNMQSTFSFLIANILIYSYAFFSKLISYLVNNCFWSKKLIWKQLK